METDISLLLTVSSLTKTTNGGSMSHMVNHELRRRNMEEHGQESGAIESGMTLRSAAKQKKVVRGDVFLLTPDQLRIDPENVRDGYDSERARNHIESLKASMRAGRHIPALEVRARADEDGRYTIVDGAHRKLAADELQREGMTIRLRCSAFGGNEVDRITYMMCSSQGLPLDPIEMARGCLKLQNWGKKVDEIAESMSKSSTWVHNQLMLAEAEPEVQQMVRDNLVSASIAIEMMRTHAKDHLKILNKLADEVRHGKRKKVTKASVHGPRVPPKTVNVLLDSLRNAYEGLGEDVMQQMEILEGKLKSEEVSEEDLRETTFSVNAATLMQIIKGSDAIREFEERCAAREARRIERAKRAAEKSEKSESLHPETSDHQKELFETDDDHDLLGEEGASVEQVVLPPDHAGSMPLAAESHPHDAVFAY